MNREIEFFVEGNPVAQPRQRHFAKMITGGKILSGNYCPENGVKSWKERIFWKAKELLNLSNTVINFPDLPINSPFKAEMIFYFDRPKSHNKKNSKEILLPKTSKPDIDNLIKAVFDTMTGVLIKDDSLAYSVTGEKYFQIPQKEPGVNIKIIWGEICG